MKDYHIRRNDVKRLSPADRTIICSVYLHRFLTFRQMLMYYAKESPKTTYASWHLRKLLEEGYLTPIPYGHDQTGYFLTPAGVYLAKRLFDIPSTELPEAPDRCHAYSWLPSNLKMHPSKLNHQEHVNTFAIQFAQRAEGMEWDYYDEKFVTNKAIYSTRARADALAEMENISLYFELDMNTEELRSLREKWEGYQTLCASNEFLDALERKPAAILFILDNDPCLIRRRRTVLKSLEKSGFLGSLGPQLEFYMGTPEEILDTVFQYILPEKVSPLFDRVKKALDIQPRPFRCENAQPSDFYGTIDGDIWSVDVYDRVRGSVLRRIFLSNRDGLFMETAEEGRPVKHLVVTDDMETLMDDVKSINCQDMSRVYYADIRDLETKPFREALCQVNNFGKIIKGG